MHVLESSTRGSTALLVLRGFGSESTLSAFHFTYFARECEHARGKIMNLSAVVACELQTSILYTH